MKTDRLIPAALAFAAAALLGVPARGGADQPHPFGDLTWRSIGPAVSGGRLAAVAGTDLDSSLLYVGAAGGGVFKSTNGGASWHAVFDKAGVGSIGALAIGPRDKNLVWVGTGEANPRNDVSYGNGVWLTRDGGVTWRHRGLDATSQISTVLIDPRNAQDVLVGALGDPFRSSRDRGVYRTTDGGDTWRHTLYVGPFSGMSDIVREPDNPNVVYAGVWQYRRAAWNLTSGGSQDGLYRSTDSGASWHKLRAPGLPGGLTGRIGLAIAPGDGRRIYALIQSTRGLLWRSADRGRTWRMISSDTLINQRPFYYSRIFVDPTDENHLFATSVHLAESKDGGKTWKRTGRGLHGDHHAAWISSDGRRILEGNDGGVGLSRDNGKTWTWQNNVPIGQLYHVGFDQQTPYNVCGGFQDNGTWCGPSDSLDPAGIVGRYWLKAGGGDGTWVWPDPLDPSLIWEAFGGGNNGGDLWLFDERTQQSLDISPYLRDTNVIAPAALRYRFNWESPLAFAPLDGRIAYFGGNVLFKTADRGRHWSIISPDLTRNDRSHQQVSGGPITLDVTGAETSDTILDIAPSAIDRQLIWIGTDDGLVQLTRDGGKSWRNVTMPGVASFGRVDGIEASRTSPGSAYAVVDDHFLGDRSPHVFATSDYGATWRQINAGLPADQFARSIRQDPKNPRILYAGLEQGVWVSLDEGGRWQPLQQNLPPASVRDIRVQAQTDDLIAATHGRSIWILDDLSPLQQLAAAQSARVFLFAPRTAYAYHQYTVHNERGAAGENPQYGAILSFYQGARARSARIDVLDAQGRIVRHLNRSQGAEAKAVPNHAGINRLAWDLTEDAPAQWRSAPEWNRGLDSGAQVVPGTYAIRLQLDAKALTRTLVVAPDPRASETAEDYRQRYAFVSALIADFSGVDVALNGLDEVEGQLRQLSAASGAPDPAVRAGARQLRNRVATLRAALTSNMRNDQDNDFLPDVLRERLQALLDTIGDSLAPPTDAQRDQAREIHALYLGDIAGYERFLSSDVAAFNRVLAATHRKPLTVPK
ncbi:MAG: hypothetical protein M3T49_00530 [Candidatus Eremiobacteraeota bacterium]|nr:hypothetical protein [Candidatus Eremiobacteraeota bacterium]